jgi:hypothetical protein
MPSEAPRRWIAALLFLFPSEFWRRYGRDMRHTFEDRLRDQPGWRTVLRTALDLFIAAVEERLSPSTFRPQEVQGDKLMPLLTQDLRFGIGVNTAMFNVAHAVVWRIALILEHRREESFRALPPDAKQEPVVVG